MDQVERDLTYRLDAVKSVCNNYGLESSECLQSQQIWENQYKTNLLSSKFSNILSGLFVIIVGIILFIYLSGVFIKFLSNKEQKYE
ncbi:MAG: hypothetical protein PHX25_02255 [Candidatus Pacebacteria bacterium]|nr:hypothetical protein [Candidatus Paceibacterota bacterium]